MIMIQNMCIKMLNITRIDISFKMKSFASILLIFGLFYWTVDSKIIVDRIEVDSNRDIGTFSFNSSLDSTGDAVFNGELISHVDVEVMKCILKFKIPDSENDKVFTKEIFAHEIEVCDLKEGVFSNFIMKAFLTNFEKSSNFKIQCPFKKGHYKIENYTIEIKSLPIPNGSQKGKFRFSCKAQTKDKKSFEKYFSLNAYGMFTN